MSHEGIKLYLDQWVETATKGIVEIDYAWVAKRMMLTCTQCKQTLTSPLPDTANDIDYAVQEFVKIHAHTGNHHSGCSCVACTKTTIFPEIPPIAVTADFKKLPAKEVALPTTEGVQVASFVASEKLFVAPNKDKDAAKLAAQLNAFKKEYSEKNLDQAATIKLLQSTQANKGIKLYLDQWVDAETKGIISQSQKTIAIGKQLLGIKEPEPTPPAPTPVKKTPIKKDITGRKFR